eukprot:TRINITY_DN4980_c0_g4_i1.p1 TRINITY_DN4980_c0_g4~~TRINITY_DN4980_c0_g4_i1.p1  ORF type:complete len:555 (+),score=66.14 TRINITY_DN4980_c0_g4_i1:169-1833(+)
MRVYDDGNWAVCTVFKCDGAVTYKGCVWGVPCGLAAVALQWCFRVQASGPYAEDADLQEMRRDWASVLASYSVALAFLLVFRTQIAYSRLWEALSSLQLIRSAWVNAASSCMAFCSTEVSMEHEIETFKNQLVRLISLLYCVSMSSVDQNQRQYEAVDLEGMDDAALTWLGCQPNQTEIVLQWIQRLIMENHHTGVLSAPAPILSRVFQELGNGMKDFNDARRIKLVPFPFPYAQMISMMLCLHVCLSVFVVSYTTRSSTVAFIGSFMSAFVFWTINYIAIEIERPYGEDANDLQLVDLSASMNCALVNLLQPGSQSIPHYKMPLGEPKSLRRETSLMRRWQHMASEKPQRRSESPLTGAHRPITNDPPSLPNSVSSLVGSQEGSRDERAAASRSSTAKELTEEALEALTSSRQCTRHYGPSLVTEPSEGVEGAPVRKTLSVGLRLATGRSSDMETKEPYLVVPMPSEKMSKFDSQRTGYSSKADETVSFAGLHVSEEGSVPAEEQGSALVRSSVLDDVLSDILDDGPASGRTSSQPSIVSRLPQSTSLAEALC